MNLFWIGLGVGLLAGSVIGVIETVRFVAEAQNRMLEQWARQWAKAHNWRMLDGYDED